MVVVAVEEEEGEVDGSVESQQLLTPAFLLWEPFFFFCGFSKKRENKIGDGDVVPQPTVTKELHEKKRGGGEMGGGGAAVE